MSGQPTLWDAPAGPEPGTIEGRWRRFHAAHPEVYAEVVSMARSLRARGFERYSIKALWEVLRYRLAERDAHEKYAMNNNYTALYAREIMRRENDLEGFFLTRERKAA